MLLDTLQSDLTAATKNRDQIRVDTLRFLLGAVINLQIEKYPLSSHQSGASLANFSISARLTLLDINSVFLIQTGAFLPQMDTDKHGFKYIKVVIPSEARNLLK